jgi:hypothetical protein
MPAGATEGEAEEQQKNKNGSGSGAEGNDHPFAPRERAPDDQRGRGLPRNESRRLGPERLLKTWASLRGRGFSRRGLAGSDLCGEAIGPGNLRLRRIGPGGPGSRRSYFVDGAGRVGDLHGNPRGRIGFRIPRNQSIEEGLFF